MVRGSLVLFMKLGKAINLYAAWSPDYRAQAYACWSYRFDEGANGRHCLSDLNLSLIDTLYQVHTAFHVFDLLHETMTAVTWNQLRRDCGESDEQEAWEKYVTSL